MNFPKFQFTLTGFMPLLMHADDIDGADKLEEWRKSPANKNMSKPGDDRSPAWTYQTYVYGDGKHVVMPAENIMAALRGAGAQLILKRQKTFKEISQSGLLIDGEACQFFNAGKQIKLADIEKFHDEPFIKHVENCERLGFKLFKKRSRVGTAKHIRVRPRFDDWQVMGVIHVLKNEITEDILKQLFELA